MCNLRVLANVIYPSTLQHWDHRHRQTYYEHGGGYVGLSMGVTPQLIEDDQISTTSYFANVNSCPKEAFVQIQLNKFLRLHHFRCFSLEPYKDILLYHYAHTCQRDTRVCRYCRYWLLRVMIMNTEKEKGSKCLPKNAENNRFCVEIIWSCGFCSSCEAAFQSSGQQDTVQMMLQVTHAVQIYRHEGRVHGWAHSKSSSAPGHVIPKGHMLNLLPYHQHTHLSSNVAEN